MNRLTLILTALCCSILMCWAQSPLSASSKLVIARKNAVNASSRMPAKPGYYQAFIGVNDESGINSLRQQGVIINGMCDGFVTAQIPVDNISNIEKVRGVNHISLAQPMQLHNDTARYLTTVDQVHQAVGHIVPLTGKGVIVGVIDVGIDYNHINFQGSDGRSRILAAYLPCDSTGVRPIVQGDTLPGSCYETPELIAQLTTDYTGSSHGTHTTGTAAGSYRGNGWYGMAPEADIVACGMPDDGLTDVNIANAIKYIFDYADRVGKPCVINMSLGNSYGPKDGTSFMCKVFEEMSGPGRILVLSAGNDGNAPMCLHHTLYNDTDTLTTLLHQQPRGVAHKGYVDMWSDRDQEHRARIVVFNQNTHELEYASPLVGMLPEDSVYTISSETDSLLARYYTGEIEFANAMELHEVVGNDTTYRYRSLWSIDAKAIDPVHLLGVQYVADETVNLVGWSSKSIYFSAYDIEGAQGGSPFGSISDLATTDSVISVGAYCSRTGYTDKNGNTYSYAMSNPYHIAYFSSFGPDERGISRPDVCAPGLAVISSANRYNDTANRQRWPSPVMIDGEEYPYYSNQGTSMSAPVVTGSVALLLQLNPSLSASGLREVLRRTSTRDEYVVSGEPEQWGLGKLNVHAAVADVIDNTLMTGDVNHDHSVNIVDVSTVVDMILSDFSHWDATNLICADVNHDGTISISDVSFIIDLILK